MNATDCRPYRQGRPHNFHPDSGWCIYGCGNRDDGRILTHQGDVIQQGPNYSTLEMSA